jgi:hypothetical protein
VGPGLATAGRFQFRRCEFLLWSCRAAEVRQRIVTSPTPLREPFSMRTRGTERPRANATDRRYLGLAAGPEVCGGSTASTFQAPTRIGPS